MSRLKDRIRRLRGTQSDHSDVDQMNAILAQDYIESASNKQNWELPDTFVCTNESGSFIKRVITYPSSYLHGQYRLNELKLETPRLRQLLKEQESEEHKLEASQLLFLDTETTGLGIGAGNVPFMIGIGWWNDDHFRIEQLFIRNPAEERAMLHYLKEKISSFATIVTYNGKTFDWPLIKNRFVLHRMKCEDPLLHLDFLYPSRSLWQKTMESCKLGLVEAKQIRFVRDGDIPGSMAPALYFQYLHSNDVTTVEKVFHHNEWDILTLAGLAVHISKLICGNVSWISFPDNQLIRYGLWLDKIGKFELAKTVMVHLFENANRIEEDRIVTELANWFKRKGKYDAAAQLWKLSCGLDRPDWAGKAGKYTDVDIYIELAKYYEHRKKNIREALSYATLAQEQILTRLSLSRRNAKYAKMTQEVRHRIQRLQRKFTE